MLFNIIEKKVRQARLIFEINCKRLVFDLTKIPFFKCLSSVNRLIVEILNDHNVFTESHLDDWFSSYVQFYSGDNFSERAAAAR